MWDKDQYELLDFGSGRKLERFGRLLLDRPSPAAEPFASARSDLWASADLRYERTSGDRGIWTSQETAPSDWHVHYDKLVLTLKDTEFGHVGLFPEQVGNWQWVGKQVQLAQRKLKVLNLFAYTGGSTLTAASAGAEVVHVDAASSSVAWARRNAATSRLTDCPIRWIVEDARKFVARECKRGNRYDGVILDPPTYGHGPRGQAWKLDQHLPSLLTACWELLDDRGEFLLFTCHSPGIGPQELQVLLHPPGSGTLQATNLDLATADGRKLPCGVLARWTRSPMCDQSS